METTKLDSNEINSLELLTKANRFTKQRVFHHGSHYERSVPSGPDGFASGLCRSKRFLSINVASFFHTAATLLSLRDPGYFVAACGLSASAGLDSVGAVGIVHEVAGDSHPHGVRSSERRIAVCIGGCWRERGSNQLASSRADRNTGQGGWNLIAPARMRVNRVGLGPPPRKCRSRRSEFDRLRANTGPSSRLWAAVARMEVRAVGI